MRPSLVSLITIAVVGVLAPEAGADTFTVNKRGDHAPGQCTAVDCTLREAAIAASAEDAAHVIKLPKTKPHRLTRSATLPAPDDVKGDLDLTTGTENVTIVHPGPGRARIDASAADDRALELTGNFSLRKVVIRKGTVGGGESGGGIHYAGSTVVSLVNSKLIGNEADQGGGGIYMADGIVFFERTVVKGNTAGGGGGIFATEEVRMTLDRSTVTENTADDGDGGGLWIGTALSEGASVIKDSTIAHNETAASGGAFATDAGLLKVENSTLTKNRAAGRGGGIYSAPDTLAELNGLTIARNRADSDDTAGVDTGGGIFANGGSVVVEIQNSLLAKNRTTGGSIQECDAPAPVGVGSLGGNLHTSASDCPFFDHPEDILDSAPGIAKLQSAGGPTQTIPLRAGSPAIGEADGPSPLERDQRGRLRDAQPDIGAYER
jgi:predicted outer membrane repeat protein